MTKVSQPDLPLYQSRHSTWTKGRYLVLAGCILYLLSRSLHPLTTKLKLLSTESTRTLYEEDLLRCKWDSVRVARSYAPPESRINPRAALHEPYLLSNATIIDGDGAVIGLRDVLVEQGTIRAVYSPGEGPSGVEVVNLGKKYLTAGIVDMHSHLGVRSLPQFGASEDVTELSSPITPQMKALDGFDPSDEALERVRSGGVTSSLVLTGASNLISGQGIAIKLRTLSSMSVEDMEVQAADPSQQQKRQRYLKMACGENPKSRGSPGTRLGEASLLREAYGLAASLMSEQEAWCSEATRWLPSTGKTRYPVNDELQPLVDVLRGDVRVNVHCYKTEDIEMMLRLSTDAGFNITALHHAVETHRMVDQLLPHRPMTLALFATEYGFKPETMHASVHNAAIMYDAGFDIAMVTDHPALNGQYPMREAAVAHNFGLPEKAALAALFSVPARTMGLDDRIGYVRPGYDADLVAWNDHPLRLGATPLQVWIDGEKQLETGASRKNSVSWVSAKVERTAPRPRNTQTRNDTCTLGSSDLVIFGLNTELHPLGTNETRSTVVVSKGRIVCTGTCEADVARALKAGAESLNITSGYMMPGITALTPMHGLTDILGESSTSDGFVDSTQISPTYSKYGLSPGGVHVRHANLVGVATIITPPRAVGPELLVRIAGGGFIKGVSMAFHSGIETAADPGAFVKEDVALHVTIGHAAKNPKTPTVSSQVQLLRHLLSNPPTTEWEEVAAGRLLLAVHAEGADSIAQVILIKRDFPGLDVTIIGASEAHLVAGQLAEFNISIVLAPWRCMQLTWDHRRCHPGVPLRDENVVQLLTRAGVKVALAAGDDRVVRDLWFEAGWASQSPSIDNSRQLATDIISNNVNDIFHIEHDHATSFSIWDADPFEYGARVAVVFNRGAVERCWPDYE